MNEPRFAGVKSRAMSFAPGPLYALALSVVLSLVMAARTAAAFEMSSGEATGQGMPPALAAAAEDPRPWTRWWWHGNAADVRELRRELELLRDAGIGGVEIQPFDTRLSEKDLTPEELARIRSHGGPGFYRNLAAAMSIARELGLGVDLNLGSGWPAGGSHVPPARSMMTLFWNERTIRGPLYWPLRLKGPRRPPLYMVSGFAKRFLNEELVRYMPGEAELVAVVAGRRTGGRRSPNPLNFRDSLALDPDSLVDLTGKVHKGRLDWDPPSGTWVVVEIWAGPDGQYVKYCAEPEEAYVIDHFDAEDVTFNMEWLLGERTGLSSFMGGPLRGFFNDSLELRTERFYTEDFLDEFEVRRGYDPRPYLPAALMTMGDNFISEGAAIESRPAYSIGEDTERIYHDYSLTASDIFIEDFLDTSAEWAEERGMLSRAQAYGLEVDVIRAQGASHIPEAEQLYAGGSEMFLKTASSGAHIYGRPLTSCESMVWRGRDYLTTPQKIKVSADKLFTSGINHIFYHGYTYRDPGAGVGRYPFFGGYSSDLSEFSPFWPYMREVNEYISACQARLRRGRPAADIAVYYPWFGFPDFRFFAGGHDEFLFNGKFGSEGESGTDPLISVMSKLIPMGVDERSDWALGLWPALQAIEDRGYTWEWINDDGLSRATADDGGLRALHMRHGAVVVPHAPWMEPDAALALADLAESGVPVLVLGDAPSRQPGYADKDQGDARVKRAMERVLAAEAGRRVEGKGGPASLADAVINRPALAYSGPCPLRLIRREVGGGAIVFLRNPTPAPAETGLVADARHGGGDSADALWLDPWSGECYRPRIGEDGTVETRLEGYGSMFLFLGAAAERELARCREGEGGQADPGRLAEWPPRSIEVARAEPGAFVVTLKDAGGPALEDEGDHAVTVSADGLFDWRDREGFRYAKGPGVYETEFSLGELGAGDRVFLELGDVHDVALVRINGEYAGRSLVAPRRVDITKQARAGANHARIEVVPALRNSLIGRAGEGAPAVAAYRGREDDLVPAGLLGPVEVVVERSAE